MKHWAKKYYENRMAASDEYWFSPPVYKSYKKVCTCGTLITMGEEGDNPIFHSDWCAWFEGTTKDKAIEEYERVIKYERSKDKR